MTAVDQSMFAARRKKLLNTIGADSIAIVATAPERHRNGDCHYPFRPGSDFYYLTGFPEPEAVAVFVPGRVAGEYILFNRKRDPKHEVWTGRRVGQKGACENFGADQAFAIDRLDEEMLKLLQGKAKLYYPMGKNHHLDHQVMAWLNALRKHVRVGVTTPQTLINLGQITHEMRLIKSDAELNLMQQAIDISVNAHKRAMQLCRPGLKEYQLEAEILHAFYQQGSRACAYDSIVAGGNNACVLHYIDNRDVLNEGDLVLIDAGAEYQNYAADITRTFPVNGKFSEPQRLLYELVLAVQKEVIAAVKPGVRWDRLQQTTIKAITQGLLDLHILTGKVDDIIAQKKYLPFYMHGVSHYLGMDVHDVGDYKRNGQWITLQSGMVLTIEPGIYIAKGTQGVDPKWQGIGIRIEDDVLVTKTGCDVLTKATPKTIAEIEALMSTAYFD